MWRRNIRKPAPNSLFIIETQPPVSLCFKMMFSRLFPFASGHKTTKHKICATKNT